MSRPEYVTKAAGALQDWCFFYSLRSSLPCVKSQIRTVMIVYSRYQGEGEEIENAREHELAKFTNVSYVLVLRLPYSAASGTSLRRICSAQILWGGVNALGEINRR